MELARLVRIWLPPILLAVFSFGAWQAANSFDFADSTGEDLDYELTVKTPVFSARRLPLTLQSPVNRDAVVPAIEEAAAQVEASLSDPSGRSCLIVADEGEILGPVTDPVGGVIPASNQKLLTTFGALGILGTEFRYRTPVVSPDALSDGAIGDLYLVGSGDPFLYTDDWLDQYESSATRFGTRLEDLADAVVEAGITDVETLHGDESLLDTSRVVDAWDPRFVEQKQSGPLSALVVNEGFVEWPATYRLSVLRTATDDPPLQAASQLAQLLAERGVTVGEVDTAIAPDSAVEIAAVESPRLVEIATHINSHSSNIGAELLLKRIGLEQAGDGSTEAGAAALVDFLQSRDLPTTGLIVNDGSGLAESNRVMCETLVALLTEAGSSSEFADSLSLAGERGSLEERFVDTPAAGRVLAKTGTLRGVKALSGYAVSDVDDLAHLSFAFIVNEDPLDDRPLEIQDDLLSALVTYPAGPPADDLAPLPASTIDG